MPARVLIALASVLVIAVAPHASAAGPFEQIYDLDLGGDEDLQFRIAVAGPSLVVGNTGLRSASVFHRRSGALVRRLECPAVDPEGGREFCGLSVAASARLIALGSVSVFVFDREGTLVKRIDLPPPDQASSLALKGKRLLVGSGSGPVYLFDARSGELLQTFDHPDGISGTSFGRSVAFAGGAVIVGVPGCGVPSTCAGNVFAFDPDTATLKWRTSALAPRVGDGFGSELARIGRDVVAAGVGCQLDPACVPVTPAVHRLDGKTGAIRQTYVLPGNHGHLALAARGGTVVVGQDLFNDLDFGGAVHVFTASTGTLLQTIEPTPPLTLGPLGEDVALDGGTILATSNSYWGDAHLRVYRRR